MTPRHLPLFILSFIALPILSGCGTTSFLVTPVENSSELKEEVVSPGSWAGGKIAIIAIDGALSNSKGGGLIGTPTENSMSLFTQQLERAQADASVKAIVLRVNSPGGTVSSADAMYDLLCRFRKKSGKPIVSSIQEVGASGAYYLSCAADKIVAQPTSLVGSIGVIFESMEFSGTLDKIGAKSWAITSGPLKEMGSSFKPLEPREQTVMQDMVEEYFARFVGIVASNRPIVEERHADVRDYKKPDYAGIYSGRVFSGSEGKKLGLIDQLGLLSDAIDLAKTLGKSPDAEVIMYRRAYGYSGSIYASSTISPAKSSGTTIEMPGMQSFVPAGFYYMWRPGI